MNKLEVDFCGIQLEIEIAHITFNATHIEAIIIPKRRPLHVDFNAIELICN